MSNSNNNIDVNSERNQVEEMLNTKYITRKTVEEKLAKTDQIDAS